MSDTVVVLTTVPSSEAGATLGAALVDAQVAACVNVLPPMVSIYRWKGQVHQDTECQVIIKTTAVRVEAVRALVREHHPYELPEFLVLRVADGDAAYLAWIREETGR